MGYVTIDRPKYYKEGNPGISAHINIGGESREVWYRVSEGPLSNGEETFLLAALVPAMKVGEPLVLKGPISPRLLHNIPKVQEIFHAWDHRLKEVPIEVQTIGSSPETAPSGVGCFFSGGVDSFYTLLKHRDEITKLIFVHGFDISLENTPLRAKVSQAIHSIAAELQKPLIEVETNIGTFANNYVDWGLHSHGTAMASVALLLSPQFRKVFIASSHSYSDLIPWGSHPIIDPLLSTEHMEIIHDGCEATRVEKVAEIALNETAMKYLRVCYVNRGGAYNCGQCEKCLVTMVNLRVAGALEKCTTFTHALDLAAVSRMRVPDMDSRVAAEENLRAVERSGKDPALAQALHDCLNRKNNVITNEMSLLTAKKSELEEMVQSLKQQNSHLEKQLSLIYQSRSWQIVQKYWCSLDSPFMGKILRPIRWILLRLIWRRDKR
jgi:7-cyano-7-deazaguanine synthase in queuosine biosynthesis